MTDETIIVDELLPLEAEPETAASSSDNTAPETGPDPVAETLPQFKFGFVVLVNEEGGVFIEKNPNLLSIPVEREASLIEVRRYTSEILMDLQAQASAEYTTLRMKAEEAQAQ